MFPLNVRGVPLLCIALHFLPFYCFSRGKRKKHILTSVLSLQYPNTHQNIQHPTFIIVDKVYQRTCFPPFSKIFGPMVKDCFGAWVLVLWTSSVYNYLMYSTIKSHFLSGFCELTHQFFTVFPLKNN